MPKSTLCLPPARWEPRALDSECSGNIARFRWDFFKSRQKLDYLYRFSRNPTPTMSVLTLCLPPARWGPKAPDSECNGNIASFRRISSNYNQNSTIYTDLIVIRHLNAKINPLSPTCSAEDPGHSIPFVVAILPDFDEFLLISIKTWLSIQM